MRFVAQDCDRSGVICVAVKFLQNDDWVGWSLPFAIDSFRVGALRGYVVRVSGLVTYCPLIGGSYDNMVNKIRT